MAIEVETGKSDIKENIAKLRAKGFDRVELVATSPAAGSACQRVLDASRGDRVELMTSLDVW